MHPEGVRDDHARAREKDMDRRTRSGVAVASHVIAGCLVAGLIVGCDGSADSSNRPTQLSYVSRDSAGVTIVESGRPAPASRLGWQVGAEPQVAIGAALGGTDYQLYQVGDATRLADGRIVVANGGSKELLVFGEDGRHLDSWAGEGDGPGEFQTLATVHRWVGDSLIAGDAQQGRASVFDLAGAHGRTMLLRGPPDAATRERAAAGQAANAEPVTVEPHVIRRVLPGGTLLTRTPRGFRQGHHRWESVYALMDADGATRASLGNHLGTETYSEFYQQDDGNFLVIPLLHPFGKATLTTAWGDLAAIGDNETYEIRAYRGDGSLARIVRRDHETRVPTQSEQDQAFRDGFAGLSEEDREPRMAVAANVPPASSFPAYASLHDDALGHLWVAEFKLPDAEYDGTLWTVFDPDGRAMGLVETPEGLGILEIGADYILGRRIGELDIESVELWRLER